MNNLQLLLQRLMAFGQLGQPEKTPTPGPITATPGLPGGIDPTGLPMGPKRLTDIPLPPDVQRQLLLSQMKGQ